MAGDLHRNVSPQHTPFHVSYDNCRQIPLSKSAQAGSIPCNVSRQDTPFDVSRGRSPEVSCFYYIKLSLLKFTIRFILDDMYNLPLECWHRILVFTQLATVITLHSCSRHFRTVVSSFFDSRYHTFLFKLSFDPKSFRAALAKSEGVIGGGAVRMILEGKEETDGIPLHIFCKNGKGIYFFEELIRSSYVYDGEQQVHHGVAPNSLVITVHRFSNENRLVEIIETPTCTYLFPSSRFRHSAQFGIASASSIWHAYPSTIGNLNLTTRTEKDYTRLAEIITRSFGDRASFRLTFGEAHDYAEPRLPVWSQIETTPLIGFEPPKRGGGKRADDREFVKLLWASLFTEV